MGKLWYVVNCGKTRTLTAGTK